MTDNNADRSRSFASDNYSGVHPEILAALAEANVGHATSYGEDPWTQRLGALATQLFGDEAQGDQHIAQLLAGFLLLQQADLDLIGGHQPHLQEPVPQSNGRLASRCG